MQTTYDEKQEKPNYVYIHIYRYCFFEDMRGFKSHEDQGVKIPKEGKLRGATTTFGTAFDLKPFLGGFPGDDFDIRKLSKKWQLGASLVVSVAKNPLCNARDTSSIPIPHATEQLTPCATTTEPAP